jgi:hypothetical protein
VQVCISASNAVAQILQNLGNTLNLFALNFQNIVFGGSARPAGRFELAEQAVQIRADEPANDRDRFAFPSLLNGQPGYLRTAAFLWRSKRRADAFGFEGAAPVTLWRSIERSSCK